jgi:hypothetical protein
MRRYFTFVPVTNRSISRGDIVTSSVIMMSVDRGVMLDLWKASRSKITRIKHKIDISKRRVLIGVQDLDGRRLTNPCLSIRMLAWSRWGPSRETQ